MLTWNTDPEIFRIGFFAIRYYSLAFLIGFLFGYHYLRKHFFANGYTEDDVSSLFTHVFLGTIIGARLAHCFFYEPEYYLAHPVQILQIWKGGLASHGGYTGIMIAVWLFLRKHRKLNFFWLCDRIAPPAILTGGLIRIGNFFNSEIYGHPTEMPWAVIFQRVDNIPRHPVQLYESFGYITIAIILFILTRKLQSKWSDGRLLGLAMVLAFSWRFFCEFFKVNQADFSSGWAIDMGQWLSLPFILIGFYFLTGKQKDNPKLQFLSLSYNERFPKESKSKKGKDKKR